MGSSIPGQIPFPVWSQISCFTILNPWPCYPPWCEQPPTHTSKYFPTHTRFLRSRTSGEVSLATPVSLCHIIGHGFPPALVDACSPFCTVDALRPRDSSFPVKLKWLPWVRAEDSTSALSWSLVGRALPKGVFATHTFPPRVRIDLSCVENHGTLLRQLHLLIKFLPRGETSAHLPLPLRSQEQTKAPFSHSAR